MPRPPSLRLLTKQTLRLLPHSASCSDTSPGREGQAAGRRRPAQARPKPAPEPSTPSQSVPSSQPTPSLWASLASSVSAGVALLGSHRWRQPGLCLSLLCRPGVLTGHRSGSQWGRGGSPLGDPGPGHSRLSGLGRGCWHLVGRARAAATQTCSPGQGTPPPQTGMIQPQMSQGSAG